LCHNFLIDWDETLRRVELKVTWLAHSCFELVESLNVLVDPYVQNNPLAPRGIDDLNPDVITVTHGHASHIGDAGDIARRTGCLVISTPEISRYLKGLGARAEGMNIGGSFRAGKSIFHMTNALHSSGIIESDHRSDHRLDHPLYGGEAAGFVIDDGVRVYHAGDTGLFGDMKLIGELYRPEVALLPIGDRFTMGPREAALAVSWIRPDIAIPMHYNTRPSISQDPADFQALVETLCDTEVIVMDVGEAIEL
jgi:L-ascorbate metabolism protein UlaG (beta-lactamase superfamily)